MPSNIVSKSKTIPPYSLFQQEEEKKKRYFPGKDNMTHKGTSYITEGPTLDTGPTEGLKLKDLIIRKL